MKLYTQEADKTINTYFKDKNLIEIIEILNHDGFDKHGPKSNLWDLFIFQNIDFLYSDDRLRQKFLFFEKTTDVEKILS